MNPLRYMAREIDRSTGLYYVRNRWYDAAVGRFLSEDPIGLEGGINWYAYAENSPTNLRDPFGLVPEDPRVIVLEGITAVGRRRSGGYSSGLNRNPSSRGSDGIAEARVRPRKRRGGVRERRRMSLRRSVIHDAMLPWLRPD